MGRKSTGAWTTNDCLRIELSYLLKMGYLVKGKITSGRLAWQRNGYPSGNITVYSYWPVNAHVEPFIRLVYTMTDRTTGDKEEHDDTVYLERRVSNLGKGEVLYFICPVSGQCCRILYKGYNCSIWKSRQAYQHRIYYPCQKSSKREYATSRYWDLDSQIEKVKGKRSPGTYRGKPTKRAERLQRLELQQWEADHQRWLPEAFPLGLRRAVFGDILGYKELASKGKRGKL